LNGWEQGGGQKEERRGQGGGRRTGERGKRRGGKGWKRGCGRESRGNIKMFDIGWVCWNEKGI